MTTKIKIWACADHHAAFLCGGWAYVRLIGGQVSGVAGGERATTAHRMAVAGLSAALAELPPVSEAPGPIALYTNSPEMAALAALPAGQAPGIDRDLWDMVVKGLAGRKLTPAQLPVTPKTPLAFTAAWAETARDKAKATGHFKAAIPKPNLAKIVGLPSG